MCIRVNLHDARGKPRITEVHNMDGSHRERKYALYLCTYVSDADATCTYGNLSSDQEIKDIPTIAEENEQGAIGLST